MANKDRIIVWMNGKKTTIRRNEPRMFSQDTITRDEHAATVDKQPYEHNNDTLALPEKEEKEYNDKNHNVSTNDYRGKRKPIILAIISAVCMGGIFGLIMLKVVGSIGDYGSTQPTANGVPSNLNGEENNNTNVDDNSDGTSYTLPALKAYVIQGGVFEEESSVNEWKDSFQDAAFSPVVWQADDKYYLFVDVAKTKEHANKIVDETMDTYGLDVFQKEWNTDGAALNLSQEEEEWMDSVTELWNKSLARIDEKAEFPIDNWKQLRKDAPEMEKQVDSFHQKLTELISNLDNPSNQEAAGFLLQVWSALENELVE